MAVLGSNATGMIPSSYYTQFTSKEVVDFLIKISLCCRRWRGVKLLYIAYSGDGRPHKSGSNPKKQ